MSGYSALGGGQPDRAHDGIAVRKWSAIERRDERADARTVLTPHFKSRTVSSFRATVDYVMAIEIS
jgi:hypothetical protein